METFEKFKSKVVSQAKVLIADDSSDWLDVLEKRLQKYGIKPTRAGNGLEAVEVLKKQAYDLVITDTNMPYMDGVSLLKFIRAFQPKLPVIVYFSGLFNSSLSKEDVIMAGANGVLEKQHTDTLLEPLVIEFLSGMNR